MGTAPARLYRLEGRNVPVCLLVLSAGLHVLVPDLRAQGESEGDFIGMGWTDSVDCGLWLDYIMSQDEAADIVLHGQSMGASAALIMSGDAVRETFGKAGGHIRAVVSDCAYTDAYEMFGDKITEWFGLPAFPFVDSACLMRRRVKRSFCLWRVPDMRSLRTRIRTDIMAQFHSFSGNMGCKK